jgi:hypothetical protein
MLDVLLIKHSFLNVIVSTASTRLPRNFLQVPYFQSGPDLCEETTGMEHHPRAELENGVNRGETHDVKASVSLPSPQA